MSEDKNKDNNQPEMDFGDELNQKSDPLDKKWGDNPFEKINDDKNISNEPKFEDENNQGEYSFSNENIEKSRSQNQGLAKVLLVLLLGVGVLIAAVLGLLNNKKDKNSSETVETTTQAVSTSAGKSNKEDPANLADPSTYCKLSEVQKYIAQDVDNLERVLGVLEGEIEELSDNESVPMSRVDFLTTKLNELSRAEDDIRAFSKPYIEKDFAISFDEESKVCKVKDGSKYLYAWLDDIKDRLDSLGDELDYLADGGDPSMLASAEDNEDQAKGFGGVLNKPAVKPSASKPNTKSSKPKAVKKAKPVKKQIAKVKRATKPKAKPVAKVKPVTKKQSVAKRNFREESLLAANRNATKESLKNNSEVKTNRVASAEGTLSHQGHSQVHSHGPTFKPYDDTNSSLSLRSKPNSNRAHGYGMKRCDSGVESRYREDSVYQGEVYETYPQEYYEVEEYCEYDYHEPVYEYCD